MGWGTFPGVGVPQQKAQQQFEAQKQVEQMSVAEAEELAVRKRRAEGTPCTKDNFLTWKAKFEAELAQSIQAEQEQANATSTGKRKEKIVDKSGRLTGFEQFSGKAGVLNLEDMEAAWENAERDEDEDEDEENLAENVDEELFDVEDDDLDDLDFEDDDNDEDDDEEPDIWNK